jgi:hypothetical protein
MSNAWQLAVMAARPRSAKFDGYWSFSVCTGQIIVLLRLMGAISKALAYRNVISYSWAHVRVKTEVIPGQFFALSADPINRNKHEIVQ